MSDTWAAFNSEVKKVDLLIPYERNSKIHSEEQIDQLVASIKEWGWTIPILIDEENNILAGHGRYEAAKKLKIKEVPCLVAKNWSDEQKRAYIIADNKLSENGEWDNALFYSELKALNDNLFDINLIGIDVDLSILNYKPNVNPTDYSKPIQEQDISNASENLNNQITNMSRDRSESAIEVICPHCAEAFLFHGSV